MPRPKKVPTQAPPRDPSVATSKEVVSTATAIMGADPKDTASQAARRDLLTLRYEIDDALAASQERDTKFGIRKDVRKIIIARDAIKRFGDSSHGTAARSARFKQGKHSGNRSNTSAGEIVTRDTIDVAVVAALRMEGRFWWEIAEIMGVSESSVKDAFTRVRDMWLESSVLDFNDRKAEEVAKIDYLERRQWETIRTVNTDSFDSEDGLTELGFRRIKNAQDVIMWCIVQRSKIFGLEAPIKVDWRFEAKKYGIDADQMYHALVSQFANQIIDAEVVQMKEIPAPNDESYEPDADSNNTAEPEQQDA